MLSAALLATLLVAAASATPCTMPLNARVVLESDEVDPDVFLWDSRTRLIDYAEGNWGDTRAIFAHTVLAEPGTLALVIACFPGVAHPRFSNGDEDAIGVKVVNGRYRGRYGWVLSSDTHAIRTAGQSDAGGQHLTSQVPGTKR
jgi:hypothetical protein